MTSGTGTEEGLRDGLMPGRFYLLILFNFMGDKSIPNLYNLEVQDSKQGKNLWEGNINPMKVRSVLCFSFYRTRQIMSTRLSADHIFPSVLGYMAVIT